MQRIVLSSAAAALLAALPAPVPAAPVSSAAVYEAGRCMVSRDYYRALGFIVSLPLDERAADLSPLRGPAADCAAGAAGASGLMLRGAIAQALFRRDFGGFGHDPRERARLVDLGLPVQDSEGGIPALDIYRWGDCVVRNDTAATERLLVSANGSPEESAAMTELQAYMVPCMPHGAQLTVSQMEARAVFAQSAYYIMYRYATGELRMTAGRR